MARAALTALKTEPSMRHQHTRMQLIEQRLESLQTPEALADRQRRILNGQTAQLHPGKHKKIEPSVKHRIRKSNSGKK